MEHHCLQEALEREFDLKLDIKAGSRAMQRCTKNHCARKSSMPLWNANQLKEQQAGAEVMRQFEKAVHAAGAG